MKKICLHRDCQQFNRSCYSFFSIAAAVFYLKYENALNVTMDCIWSNLKEKVYINYILALFVQDIYHIKDY